MATRNNDRRNRFERSFDQFYDRRYYNPLLTPEVETSTALEIELENLRKAAIEKNEEVAKKPTINYIWDEKNVLAELGKYVDSTYSQHYAGDQVIQTTEYIASNLNPVEAVGAFKFNVLKYAARYGKKAGKNKADLMKAMHYLIMLMAIHNRTENKTEN